MRMYARDQSLAAARLVRNGAESASGDPSLVTYGMAFDLGHSCLN